MLHPIILCGGSGSRLWPLSRTLYPKQFLRLLSEDSLLQSTLKRLNTLDTSAPTLICNHEHRFLAAEQMQSFVDEAHIILEPEGRNTAPAIAAAAHYSLQKDPEATLLILSADHFIKDPQAFADAIAQALPLAEKQSLITLGVPPSEPHTGYGYIKKGSLLSGDNYQVERFIEKPNLDLAESYVKSQQYYWNSGIFLFKAQAILAAMQQYCPNIVKQTKAAVDYAKQDLDFFRLSDEHFCACENISIDYAVMEKHHDIVVTALNTHWSDIGAFSAIWELKDKDENNNASQGNVVSLNATNNLIHTTDENQLVALIGVHDMLVVETNDALLIANKAQSEQVKHIVDQLKAQKDPRTQLHTQVHRPWGWYLSITNGATFQVKRIHVKPGAKLSLQKHRYRSEHWVVIKGIATVRCNEQTLTLNINESTFIPLGAVHQLANHTDDPLEIIEVQNGSYLGEDDIIRLEDDYNRH